MTQTLEPPIRVRRSEQVPPRERWPRVKLSPEDRPRCERCGTPYRVVSTPGAVAYYGPAECPGCGCRRRLRKRERRIDWDEMRRLFLGFD